MLLPNAMRDQEPQPDTKIAALWVAGIRCPVKYARDPVEKWAWGFIDAYEIAP